MKVRLWALSAAAAYADTINVLAKSSVYACASLVANVTWGFQNQEFYAAMCLYEPAIGSWVTCIDQCLSEKETAFSQKARSLCVRQMNSRCKDTFDVFFTEERFNLSFNNASQYLETGRLFENPGFTPIEFNRGRREALRQAWSVSLRNLDNSNAASVYLYAFLAIISTVAITVHHFHSLLFSKAMINRIRSSWTLPTLRQKHAQPVVRAPGGLLPTRLESGIIAGFIAAHTVALFFNYELDPNEALENTTMQIFKNLGCRTGLLAFAQFPLIIYFSGRNSMFEGLTGLHYTTSIVLHKWISRLMVFDATVHGGVFLVRAYLGGYLAHAGKSHLWVCGRGALVVGTLICLLAFGVLRHRWYELFLVVHAVLAGVFFYLAWEHVKVLGWSKWVYVSVALWILEKLLRLKRILVFGGCVRAQVDAFEPDIMRLTIPKPSCGWKTLPGQYIFLYILLPTTWWQSHPFTFVDLGDHIVLVIKAKKGATNKLLAQVKQPLGLSTVKVCVEGPYGESAPVSHFDNKLFVCGGSGIPGPLSYVLNTPMPMMKLIVVARDFDIIRAFHKELAGLSKSCLQIYVTGGSTSTYGTFNESRFPGETSVAVIRGRRPDIPALIGEFMDANGSLAITCCGPPALVDMTRDLAAHALKAHPAKRMGYYEEYQTW